MSRKYALATWLYCFHSPSAGVVKVGVSVNVPARLRRLRATAPDVLFVEKWPVGELTQVRALAVESVVQRAVRERVKASHGREWYPLATGEAVDIISSALAAWRAS